MRMTRCNFGYSGDWQAIENDGAICSQNDGAISSPFPQWQIVRLSESPADYIIVLQNRQRK